MTKVRYITILAFLAVALGSCKKDFLTLYPEGNINENTFYKSATDFQQALVGAYVPLRDAANIAFFMEEMRSDNAYYDYNTKDRGGLGYEQLADFMDDMQNGLTPQLWTADFKGIQRVNVILDRLLLATAVPDSVKPQIIGEAKALRAHYYFELVRLFGKLPMYLHEVKNNAQTLIPRSSTDSVYAQIIADFSDAMSMLSAPNPLKQTGRVTKGMVATELGLVYLTLKQYDKATPLFQSVTQMGYNLLPNYADVFLPGNKNSAESIFEVQYKSGTDGQQSQFIYRWIPVTPSTKNILGVDYNNGLGGWNVPSADLVSIYEPGDLRLDASIAVVKGKLDANVDFQPDSVTSILSPSVNPAGVLSKRFIKKQYHLPYGLQNNTDDNWPWYRYSDVLLMLAESLNEQGKAGDALPYLNKVRIRAGLTGSTETDQTALRAVIAHERRVELSFENHRWFDLLRTNQAIDVMTAYGVKQKQNFSYLLQASYNVTKERLIYAIPYSETTFNILLGQNPGYN